MKKILIPTLAVATLAVSGTALAANPDFFANADITDAQRSALEQAHEIRDEARTEAQAILEAAGLDKETMQSLREAHREAHNEQREAISAAVTAGDYAAFQTLIADSPLAESITSESDFETFAEAQALREAGDHEGAHELMSELGIEGKEGEKGGRNGFGGPGPRGNRQSAEAV